MSSLWDYASSSLVPNLTAPVFNGDGRADFLHTWKEQIFGFPADPECPDPFYMNYYFEVASGDASYSDFEWIQLTCEEIVNLKILDINGDGLTDLLYRKQTPVTFSSVWFVRTSTGSGLSSESELEIPTAYASLAFVTDYDSDGRDDLGWRRRTPEQ